MNLEMNLLFVAYYPLIRWRPFVRHVIKNVDEVPITLENIAEVKTGAKAPKMGLASERGKAGILLTVTKQPNTSTLDLTGKLDKSLEDLQKVLPKDVKVLPIFSVNPVLLIIRLIMFRSLYMKAVSL